MNKGSNVFLIDGVSDLLKQVGSNIKIARTRRGLTIKELANKIHVDERTISRMESGDPSINFKNLATVLIVFGIEESIGMLANPDTDEIGKALELKKHPQRIRNKQKTVSDDF